MLIKKLITLLIFILTASVALANSSADPIVVNATINAATITLSPNQIPANNPFIIHIINKSGSPVELENTDTSVEVYDGMDKTFRVGLDVGKYKFFNDFNPKTKIGILSVEKGILPATINNDSSAGSDTPSNKVTSGQSNLSQIVFIMWRESIEALLVVGIVFGWLKQLNKEQRKKGMLFLWLGVASGVLFAVLLGVALVDISAETSGFVRTYIQAGITTTAALMIMYMVKWMRVSGKRLKSDMYNSLNKMHGWEISILAVTAIAIAREGSEATIFIYALGFGQHGFVSNSMLIAAVSGMLLAIVTIYLFQLSKSFLTWKYFFRITEVLLLLLGGSLLLNGGDMLISTGIIPALHTKIWDSSGLIDSGGFFAPLLNSLIGYRPTPSFMDLIIYAAYWLCVYLFIFKPRKTALN